MRKKYLLYMLFAAICVFINLGSQSLVEYLLAGIPALQKIIFSFKLSFILKLATGTILGFVAKFILDKFIVFRERQNSITGTLRQIFIYGLFAVITTIIFWGFEMSFNRIFHSEVMDLAGGFIGLAIGYTLKFFLDKKFVFTSQPQQPAG